MSGPRTIRAPRETNRYIRRLIFINLFVIFLLSCGFLSNSQADDSSQTSKDRILYDNGVEVGKLPNGVVLITDSMGNYGIALPKYWNAGPLTAQFSPVVADIGKTNPAVSHAFETIVDQPGYTRIFAVDILPEHLDGNYYALLTISAAQDDNCTASPVSLIADATMSQLTSNFPDTVILNTKEGKSNFDVPWFYFESRVKDSYGEMTYSGNVVANTGETCIKLNYLTNNSRVDIYNEFSIPLYSLASIDK